MSNRISSVTKNSSDSILIIITFSKLEGVIGISVILFQA
jgi:hypothetical protein